MFDLSGFEPGVYYDIPEHVYHREISAVSSHFLMQISKSMAHAYAYLTEPHEATSAMELGRLIHLAILEPERFRQEALPSDVPAKNLKAYKDLVGNNPDKIVLSGPETEKITKMCQAIMRHKKAPKCIQGGNTEVTILAKCPITGLGLKGRVDFESSTMPYFLDYKTCEDASLKGVERSIGTYKYHIQLAYYLYLYELAGKPMKHAFVLAQEKSAPYECALFELDHNTLDYGKRIVKKRLLETAYAVKTNNWPGYTDDILVAELPLWAYENDILIDEEY